MPNFQNPHYLESVQYKDAGNLNNRIQLHQRFSTNPYGWFHWLFDQFDLPLMSNVLEIGCGPGILWMDNQDRIPAGWSICLSDFSPGMIRQSQVNLGNGRKAFTFIVFNAMDIPFKDETFDAIIANHMLYHIPDRQKVLAEIARVLRPGAHIYAATNGKNHLSELTEIIHQNMQSADISYLPTLFTEEFSLENGSLQLAPWFEQVEIHRYEDSLVVTEAEPLVNYIYSMISRSDNLSGRSRISDLRRSINAMISQKGSIHIQKSTGVFIGVKRGGVSDA
jgi:ubiquinone/menaquinone biosynthesis C-methylase UbiE